MAANIIHQGDFAVLEWIATRSGDYGAELLELLRTRKLYKRVLLLSREKNADGDLIGPLYEFQKTNRKHWERRRRLQVELQKRVVESLEEKGAKPLSAPLTADDRNKFLSACQSRPIMLVDVPLERSSDQALEYLLEEDRKKYKGQELRTGNLETSVVWKSIQRSFRESIGKIRVFCHPDHCQYLAAAVSHEDLEGALGVALGRAEQ